MADPSARRNCRTSSRCRTRCRSSSCGPSSASSTPRGSSGPTGCSAWRARERRRERRPIAALHAGRRRRRRVLRQPCDSEMHFMVLLLDDVPAMRGVLCLFEGVVTGRGRRLRRGWCPAATLLHLGPGLGNGLANLHNAVGAHAHRQHRRRPRYLPRPLRHACRSNRTSHPSPAPSRGGTARSPPGPTTWRVTPPTRWRPRRGHPAASPLSCSRPTRRGRSRPPGPARRGQGGSALRGAGGHDRGGREDPALGRAGGASPGRHRGPGGRPARSQPGRRGPGAALLGETFPANLFQRGAGVPAVERLAYLAEMAQAQLEGVRHLVLVDASSRRPSSPTPARRATWCRRAAPCTRWPARARTPGALEALAEALGAPADGAAPAPSPPAVRRAPSRRSLWPPPWGRPCPRVPS